MEKLSWSVTEHVYYNSNLSANKTFDSQSFFIIISKSKRHVAHIYDSYKMT